MKATVVQVPVSLLLDPALGASAKLVWMALRLQAQPGPALLEAHCALSQATVRRGWARLAATGWALVVPGEQATAIDRAPSDARVTLPGDLLADSRVGAHAKVLYGVLQLLPEFKSGAGQFTYPGLSGECRASPNTVKRGVGELVHAGWLQATQSHRLAPVRFSLRNPRLARGEAEVARARRRLEEAPFLGEALMREYLSLLIDSDDFQDNATPGFLVNPWTDERMELDRFYPPSVAFEFNGPQHYGPTDRFSREDAAKQQGRDYMKLGICLTRGITLVVIRPEDLSLEVMQAKVGQCSQAPGTGAKGLPGLPLRDLNGWEPLIDFLRPVSRRYRLAARRGRRPAPAAARPSIQ